MTSNNWSWEACKWRAFETLVEKIGQRRQERNGSDPTKMKKPAIKWDEAWVFPIGIRDWYISMRWQEFRQAMPPVTGKIRSLETKTTLICLNSARKSTTASCNLLSSAFFEMSWPRYLTCRIKSTYKQDHFHGLIACPWFHHDSETSAKSFMTWTGCIWDH